MSAIAFQFTSTTTITAQPDTAGQNLIARSASAADTGNIILTGLVGSAGDTETKALTGKREVKTTSAFKSLKRVALSAAQAGIVKLYAPGTAGTAPLRVEAQPSDTDTLTIGLTGFTTVYRFKNTTAQAYDVKIGADATATALNLKKAINADGLGNGTDYHTGTLVHPTLSASVSGTFLTLTDRIAIERLLVWSFAQSATGFSLPTNLTGAVTGTLLATLAVGVTQLYNSFTLSTEDLVTAKLPGQFLGSSAWIAVGGKPCALRFKCDDVTNAIALNYKTSTDRANAATGASSITNLDDNAVATPLVVKPTEQNVEYIQLTITSNDNDDDTALDARVIF